MDGEVIKFPSCEKKELVKGHAGLKSHVPGGLTTVSCVSLHSGGIHSGNLTESDSK